MHAPKQQIKIKTHKWNHFVIAKKPLITYMCLLSLLRTKTEFKKLKVWTLDYSKDEEMGQKVYIIKSLKVFFTFEFFFHEFIFFMNSIIHWVKGIICWLHEMYCQHLGNIYFSLLEWIQVQWLRNISFPLVFGKNLYKWLQAEAGEARICKGTQISFHYYSQK